MRSKIKIILYPTIFITSIVLAGCGVWENFTTYFNRYYNIVQLFNEAEKSIQNSRTDIFSLTEPPISYSDKQKLDGVIEKCSKILQFNPDSKYVDDALLILGKTFYYQQNYLKSSREFEELLSTQNDSDLRLEASLWLAKCQIRLNNQDAGLKTLNLVKEQAKQEEESDILQLALIEEIKYYLSQKQIDNAIKSAEDFIAFTDENERSEKVEYELGQLYEEKNDFENATRTYQKLVDSSPSFDMELNASLALGKAYRKNGQVEKAFEIFDNLSNEDKNKSSLDQINLEKGITLYDLGKYQEAADILIDVDTTYRTSIFAAAAKYELGRIYENVYNNFDSAGYYYGSSVLMQLPLDYVKEALSKSAMFNKYKNITNELYFNKTQLNYAQNPNEFVKDSTKYYDQKKSIEELIQAQQNQQGVDRSRTLGSGLQSPQKLLAELGKPPVMPIVPADSIKKKIANNEFDLGNLFFTEMNRMDSTYYYYSDIINNFPQSDIVPQALFALGNYYLTVGDSLKADSLFNVVYTNYKDNTIVNSAANILNKPTIDFDFDPAKNFYADAESDLNNKNYTTSLKKFYDISKNYPTSASAPKALYASGWILENELLKLDSAAAVYDTLIKRYPQSEYAKNIALKIATYHKEMEKQQKAIKDSLDALAEKKLKTEIADSLDALKKKLPPEEQKIIEANKKLPPELRKIPEEIKPSDGIKNVDSTLPKNDILKKNEEVKKDSL